MAAGMDPGRSEQSVESTSGKGRTAIPQPADKRALSSVHRGKKNLTFIHLQAGMDGNLLLVHVSPRVVAPLLTVFVLVLAGLQ